MNEQENIDEYLDTLDFEERQKAERELKEEKEKPWVYKEEE